jgi:signal recognition particle subunit SRP54
MFDNLQEKLDRALKNLKGQGKITEINVAETMKEVRKALLDADVNYKVAKTFTDTVKEKNRLWWLATYTVPLLSTSCMYWVNK